MAGRGPAPKATRQRDRDTAERQVVEVIAPGLQGLPDDLLPDGETWHPATLRWWTTWAESPLAAGLPLVDWRELETCAVLHHEFMRKRTFTLASELRLRVAKFGASPEDRMRLKIKVETPTASGSSQASAAAVTDIRSRRSRLTG